MFEAYRIIVFVVVILLGERRRRLQAFGFNVHGVADERSEDAAGLGRLDESVLKKKRNQQIQIKVEKTRQTFMAHQSSEPEL